MNLSRRDWAERQQTTQAERANTKGLGDALAKLRTASVAMERLTGSEEWDFYLRMVEARQQEDLAQLRAVQAELCDPEYMDPEKVVDLRHRMARIIGRIEARKEVTVFPKEITASGRAAADRK